MFQNYTIMYLILFNERKLCSSPFKIIFQASYVLSFSFSKLLH